MEVKATCKYDLDSIKALTHLAMFKKADPKKRMILWSAVYAILLVLVVGEMLCFGPSSNLFVMLGLCVGIPLLVCFFYFAVPKLQYRALATLQGAENSYTFYDTHLTAVTKSDRITGESRLEYSALVRVYETSRYFFLHQTRNQVLLVDKSTVTNGTAADIRYALHGYLKEKYHICNY